MFKSWRSDKKKIKVIFKLQFQATQVPKLKKSAVTISLVPDDVGKPTLRLEKVAAQDGTCLWENPVYEKMKLIRETKTGKLSEKIYHFIVSNGSSKAGFLGEASIDFADFVEETEPITVSLPLKFANSGAILHVTIHKLQGDTDQRYLEDNEDLALSRDGSLQHQESNYNLDESNQNFALDEHLNMARDAEVNGSITTKHMHQRSNTEWSVGSVSEGSLVESSNSPEDVPREWQEASDNSIQKLKNENVILMRQVEVSELELQSLRKQIMKENKRTQDLSLQISILREERDTLETEFEQLKSQTHTEEAAIQSRLQAENEESRDLVEEIRQELSHEKELNSNLRLQLQKTQDSNSNLILAVRDLNEMLEEKNKEISRLSTKIERSINSEEVQTIDSENHNALEKLVEEQNDANEVDILKQAITELNVELEHYRKEKEELEVHIEQQSREYKDLKQENYNISFKLEQSQRLQSMIQNELSESVATIEELESQVQTLEEKIKQQSEACSESLIAINELESQVKELKKELEKQAQGFEDDLEAMIHAKTEQEQRAIRAEEALRKTRWKNAVTAERLQEEFKRLSVEMATKFDENEKLTMKAVAEANELRLQKRNLEEMLQKANEELGLVKNQNKLREQELSDQLDLKSKQTQQMSTELDEKTKQLEHSEKLEEEQNEAFSKEIQMLRTEIEKLAEEKQQFSKQAEENAKQGDETEQMKASVSKSEMLIRRWNKERDDLEKQITSAKNEALQAQEQLINMRSLNDEKEQKITKLQSEMEKVRVEYNDLKHNSIKEEMEKEKLRKQVFQLKVDLQKKKEEIRSSKKEHKSNGGQAAFSYQDVTPRSSQPTSPPPNCKDIVNLKKKLQLLKEQIKLKEAAGETVSTSALGNGKQLSYLFEELERSIEQLEDCQCLHADFQKEGICARNFTATATKSEERRNSGENLLHSKMSSKDALSVSEVTVAPERNKETTAEKELKSSIYNSRDDLNITELLSELTFLKERNKTMERELKDMEERYSEISLKFAEVEGERQQLVMTVRNLKNGKKS